PQQELSADEALWYHMVNHSTKSSDALLIKIESPKEHPKVSLVNESLKKLKLHLANFDKLVRIRTTPNAQTEEKKIKELDTIIFKVGQSVHTMYMLTKPQDFYDNIHKQALAQTTTNADGTSTTLIPSPITTEEKAQKKNDVKARSMLPMALPNEHLITFNQYKGWLEFMKKLNLLLRKNGKTLEQEFKMMKKVGNHTEAYQFFNDMLKSFDKDDLVMLWMDWKTSKQSTTAMLATEAEYIIASKAAMEAVWIRKFISGLGIVPTINEPIRMFCDNSATLHFANEPRVQRGAKHYHRRYHYVRESIVLGKIRFLKVHTYDNLADPFTKALSKGKLTQHDRSMRLHLASSFM
nr:retrovirus-related Pol polyprotein from transposon TNT 1-94 [Tanacetum cinerariifolium]